MGKFWNYIMLIGILTMLFHASGMLGSGEGIMAKDFKAINETTGEPSTEGIASFRDFNWFLTFYEWVGFLAGTGAGIVIGLLVSKDSGYQIGSFGFVGGVGGLFIAELGLLANKLLTLGGITPYIIAIFGVPLMMGYIMAAWEWIGSHD